MTLCPTCHTPMPEGWGPEGCPGCREGDALDDAPQTEAEAIEELTRALGELEPLNRETAADLRELGLLTRKDEAMSDKPDGGPVFPILDANQTCCFGMSKRLLIAALILPHVAKHYCDYECNEVNTREVGCQALMWADGLLAEEAK